MPATPENDSRSEERTACDITSAAMVSTVTCGGLVPAAGTEMKGRECAEPPTA
jgi:hypothetical protein